MERDSETDLGRLWKEQARGTGEVPLDEIRSRAVRLDAKTRRWRVGTQALFVVLLLAEGWQVWAGMELLERVGDALTIAALVYVAYRFRRYRLASPPAALGRTTCREFYRAELIRQRDLSKDSWGYLLPFVPGVALSLFGSGFADRPAGQVLALVAFGIGLFAATAWWNARTVRKLQRELDALDPS